MWCNKCSSDKDENEFYRNKSRTSGRSGFCKSCMSTYDVSENSRRTSRRHYYRNKGKYYAKSNKYRASKLQATPKWLTKEMIKQMEDLYCQAKELDGMEVDHIIPLNGKDVCGLHVPWNLQLLPAEENRKKSNNY